MGGFGLDLEKKLCLARRVSSRMVFLWVRNKFLRDHQPLWNVKQYKRNCPPGWTTSCPRPPGPCSRRTWKGVRPAGRNGDKLTALDAALGNLAAPVPMGLAEKVAAKVRRPRRRSGWQSVALAACLVLGIALGGTMARGFYGPATADTTGAEVASLEDFHDFPQGSLGAVVASYQPEEGNGNLQ